MKALRANLLLLLTAMIWGVAFVAQSVGGDLIPPFTFLALRSWLGGLALLPLVLWRGRGGTYRSRRKTTLLTGLICGFVLFLASFAQQYGMTLDASPATAGFLTTLYVPLVPLLALLVFRQGVHWNVWGSIVLAVIGLALLSGLGAGFGSGEWVLLLCALLYAIHILVIDRFSDRTDPVLLSLVQFLVCAAVSTVMALLFDKTSMEAILQARWAILYTGLLSSGVGYTLQVVAQRDTSPTIASLIMSFESVFACLSGWLILGDRPGPMKLAGCGLMFCAVLLAQAPLTPKPVQSDDVSRSDSR